MKKIVFLVITFCYISSLPSKEPDKQSICSGFADCLSKADATDIHRKKITFFDEAILQFKPTDKEAKKIEVLLKRANSLIKEANGDSGYRGDVILKVTHKPEYKKGQFAKAKQDLLSIEPKKNLLDDEDLKLFAELQSEVQKSE